jgi:uncharacterized protein with GYD domain
MRDYLIQVAYTPEATAALLKKPQDRIKVVTPVIESFGGKVIGGGFCFGEYDIAILVSLPDNASAAAVAMTFGAGGGLKAIKTTPLLSASEAVKGMKMASQSKYKPPTS